MRAQGSAHRQPVLLKSGTALLFAAAVMLAASVEAQPTEEDPPPPPSTSSSALPVTTAPTTRPTTQSSRRSNDGVLLPEVTAEPEGKKYDVVGDLIGSVPEKVNGHVYNVLKSKAAIQDYNIDPADVNEEWFVRKYQGAPVAGLELTGGRVTGVRLYFAHADAKKYFEVISTYAKLREQGLAVEAWEWPRKDDSAKVEPLVGNSAVLVPGAHNFWIRIASRNPTHDPHKEEVLQAILKHQVIRGMTIAEATEAAGPGSVHYHDGRILWIDWTLRLPGEIHVNGNQSTLHGAEIIGIIRVHFENDIAVRVLEIKDEDTKSDAKEQ